MNTPLLLACKFGNLNIVRILLKFGADIEKANYESKFEMVFLCFEKMESLTYGYC